MKQYFILILSLVLITFSTSAQVPVKITGTVKDGAGKLLQSTSVSLINAADSSLVKLAVTDSVGYYEFSTIKPGTYFVSFSSVGFSRSYTQPFEFDGNKNTEIPPSILKMEATGLSGVTVQSIRPLVENKIDKMVVNVDASPSNAGATAMEVLEKSPGVSVDRDGNISLKGKQGIIILIDGKQTYLGGQDLANFLRNMPASQLDQIEIMTQPSAKYDASGNSGIINLRTKKNRQTGFNGSINLSYVQGRYPKSPNSFNFNYRKGKINLFTNFSYSYWTNSKDQQLLRRFKRDGALESVFDQQADQMTRSQNFNGRIGLDYTLNKTTTIGFLINGTHSPATWENNGRAEIYNGTGDLDSFNMANTFNSRVWKNFGTAINFRRLLDKKGREITADVDMLQYNTNNKQTSDNFNYYPNGTLIRDPFLLRGNMPSEISIYSGSIDYAHPLPKDAKIEAGIKSSFVSTDNDAQYTNYDHHDEIWVTDYGRSNHFLYKENINAAYINYTRQIKKWGIQTGIRLENTIADGYTEGFEFSSSVNQFVPFDSSFKKNYTQFFPTAYLNYSLNDHNTFRLSYGRRVERPNYQDMNPFQYFLDQYTFQQGNPNLTPQFSHNIEFSHNYRKALNTTVNYTYTTDIINNILKQNDNTKVTYETKENLAQRRTIGLAVSYTKAVTPWWTTTVYLNVNNNHYEGMVNNLRLNASLTSFIGNSSQQFRFAKTWSAEINGFYHSQAQETGLFLLEPMGVISFGFGKQLFNNKANLKLSLTDPFYIQKVKVTIDHGNIDAVVHNKWDNRRVGLSISYRFNKGHNIEQRKRTSSALEEQNRVGGNNQ